MPEGRRQGSRTAGRAARLFWGCYGAVYDGLPRHFVPYRRQLERVLAVVRERHAPGEERVLDAGCGTGNYLAALQAAGYRSTGVDQAPWMVARARRKLQRTARGAPADAQVADLTARLPFDAATFGCVVSINALYMLPQPSRALAELARVTRPGGTLVLSHPRRMPGLLEILRDHARRYGALSVVRPLGSFALLGAFNWVIARRFSSGSYFCWDEAELRAQLSAAGFAVESVEAAYACDSNLLVAARRL